MQYALIALGEHRILVDACEVPVLNGWREHPITEPTALKGGTNSRSIKPTGNSVSMQSVLTGSPGVC